jgi:hypothetical protein
MTKGHGNCKDEYLKEKDLNNLFSEALSKFQIEDTLSNWKIQAFKRISS